MRIGILGATSQIAKDLIFNMENRHCNNLVLFGRSKSRVSKWLEANGLKDKCQVSDYAQLNEWNFDSIINFVGVGDPAKAIEIGGSIFDITIFYDNLALEYLKKNPLCKYIFLSSGAAYGSDFSEPVSEHTNAVLNINSVTCRDWYGMSKLHAEYRHRALQDYSIVDVRVFNYFSRSHDLTSKFFVSDVLNNVMDDTVLQVSADHMVRDYLHPSDFFELIESVLSVSSINDTLDCYTREPIDKISMLELFRTEFGLKYEVVSGKQTLNATGAKPYYFSKNKKASLIGYSPKMTSAMCIVEETRAIFDKCGFQCKA